mgnify:CR=1 FL=1
MTNNILAGDIHQKNLDKTTTNIHSRHPQTHIHVEKILFMTHEEKIVHAQIQELPIQLQQLFFSDVDTLTNNDYSSYRRLKSPCRNWSFIYLKPKNTD